MLASAAPYRSALVLLLAATAQAQVAARAPHAPLHRSSLSGSAESPDPNVIFLDPAYSDPTNHIGSAPERDVTLNFANKLRDLLTAHAFKVVIADGGKEDQQSELANRSHASACLLLHASTGGHGVHLYTSSLTVAPAAAPTATASTTAAPKPAEPQRTIIPWDTAQAAALPQSLDLASDLATTLNAIRLPLVTGRASIAPIDSMVCAAVAIELAPYTPGHEATLEPGDATYQQHVAEAVVTALLFRRQKIQSAAPTATPQEPVP